MNTLAYKIATAIKRADPERTHSIEVMQYSLAILLNTTFIIVISLFIGLVTDKLGPTAVTLCSFIILRLTSGGLHIRSVWGCNIVSTLLFVLIPQISFISSPILLVINLISLIIMILFAPQPDANARIPLKIFPILKIISILLVISNFLIGSEVMGLAFFAQSLTIIPWRREAIV
jgi:accessory gene regulator B